MWLEYQGYQVTLGECYRPDFVAEIYAKQGKGIKNSLHTLRLAIDLNLFKDGKFLTSVEDYKEAGEHWESMAGAWGGRFTPPDANHFSLAYNGVR